jgi:D-ribose pyranose/furanose isomerase RbsD
MIYIQLLVFAFLLSACNQNSKETASWQTKFQKKLPLLGHRNWILVVDKAFPLQSAQGMTMINTGEQLPKVLEQVLTSISKTKHIKPIVFTDLELKYLSEDLSPGVDSMKMSIFSTLNGYEINSILHNEVFAKLDSASNLFNVVVLKTESTIPYSSVFIQLDCTYWGRSREQKLRYKMAEKTN